MSASVAPLMAGLPNYDFGPDNMPDFSATDFSDHMGLDRSPDLDHNFSDNDNNDSSKPQRRSNTLTANGITSNEEHKEALGNLLGALMPQQNESGDRSNFTVEDGAATVQEQMTSNAQAQIQEDNQAVYDGSRLPSFDATAANELFGTEDFSQLDQPLTTPRTPNGQVVHDNDMTHFRQNSFASQESAARRPATPQQREFEAFARLQFEDGSYYLNTYACELGRDVLAYRAALEKEREEKEAEMDVYGKSHSSSGRASHRSGRMRRQLGSQVQGSVVSEQGGFAGIDESPMRPPQNPEKPSTSSQESESSVVKPAEYLINPRTMPSFDYHRSAELQAKWIAQEENQGKAPEDEEPAAVTAAHLPNPHMCPLIPVHGKPKDGQTDAELHKKISRRHVKIQWSFERDRWEMKVQGRNGAFCDGMFVSWNSIVPLHDGSTMQIAHVLLTFRLPKAPQPQQEPQQEQIDLDVDDADEALPSVEERFSETPVSDGRRESYVEQKGTPKISLKLTQKTEQTSPELPLGPDGLPVMKRRGPGRPPKDGIMSTRERKEREKAAKMAAAREANGGKTPPASMRPKLSKPTPPIAEEIKVEIKPEKRKYTRRKTIDENGNPLPELEGEGEETETIGDEPKTKKARTQKEKSESPEYPPKESLTAEQLARPPESYAQLLHKILLELYPRALPLKEIYRELKKRYPWYVYETQTEGWQSSVRHNLNSEFGKFFDKGDKEGKGFAWRAIPHAQVPQSEKKRTAPAPVQRPSRPQQQRPQFQALPGQNVQWQNTGAIPANAGPQPFPNNGSWPPSGQASNGWQPNGTPPAGVQQGLPSGPPGIVQQNSVSQTPQPGSAQAQGLATGVNGPHTNLPPPPAPAPAPVSFSSAASNMPCTLDGIEAIKRFEREMYRQLGADDANQSKKEFWFQIFASAKKRILHGHPVSTHPKGDGKEEATIMHHLENFVQRFANPNFKGFTPRPPLPAAEGLIAPAQSMHSPQGPPQDASLAAGVTNGSVTRDGSIMEDQESISPRTTFLPRPVATQPPVAEQAPTEALETTPVQNFNTGQDNLDEQSVVATSTANES